MSIISEKVAYLEGLMEGMKISPDTNEGKLFAEILSVLADIGESIEEIEDAQDELFDAVYDLEDDVDELFGCDGNCEDCDGCDDDEEFVITCPSCGESFYVYEDDLLSEDPVECPSCGQEIELEIECDCEKDEEDK